MIEKVVVALFIIFISIASAQGWGAIEPSPESDRINARAGASASISASVSELKEILQQEKPQYELREASRRSLIEELDSINSDQNRVRERISEIRLNHRELAMAYDNLSMEFQKQQDAQRIEKNRLVGLARFLYKVKKDGFLRFVARGENLAHLAGRIRILYRTFRSHAELTQKLDERAGRLKSSQDRIATVHSELEKVLRELAEQEQLLGGYLQRKRQMISHILEKQSAYERAVREYRRLSSELAQLFSGFDSARTAGNSTGSPSGRTTTGTSQRPKKQSLPLPVATGKIIRGFGKDVHAQFGTVVFHKGIEIGAEHNAPVGAVFGGWVEFSGWLKGLGNVLILNHGGGLYSLCGHLFKATKEKGDAVVQGETIGYVGDTGNVERASLYFEIRENGKAVNPLAYFTSETLKGVL